MTRPICPYPLGVILLAGTVFLQNQPALAQAPQNRERVMENARNGGQVLSPEARRNLRNRLANTERPQRFGQRNNPNANGRPGANSMDEPMATAARSTSGTQTNGSPSLRNRFQGGNNGAQGPIRAVLEKLNDTQRQQAIAYVRNLTEEQRRSLFQSINRTPEDQRVSSLMEIVSTGKPPITAAEVLKKVGATPASQLPPLVMNERTTSSLDFQIRQAGSAGPEGRLPELGRSIPVLSGVTVQGHPIQLGQAQGKPLIVQVGSLTSPRYRASLGQLEQLRGRLGGKVQTITVYTREAHPTNAPSPFATGVWVPQINQIQSMLLPESTTIEERRSRAKIAGDQLRDLSTMVVDSMDNRLWKALGSRAHALIVVGADGRVLHASDPADFRAAEAALKDLVGGSSQAVRASLP